MERYGMFDAAGQPLAFYASDVHGALFLPVLGPVPDATDEVPNPVAPVVGQRRNPAIPDDVVALTDAQWRELIAYPGRRRWDGVGVVPYVPELPGSDLPGYAAARHLAARDGGVTVGGLRIKTDAESRGLIDGADALCQRDPDAQIDFKAASGWVRLGAPMMRAVALAVGRWVQSCYSTYRLVSDGIAAGAITSAAQIDAAFAALERQD